MERGGVRILGYVEDLKATFRQSRAMIVPTPIDLGFRTRILDAFRHGLTVVAHPANALGFPELAHEKNALLAEDGIAMARQIQRLAEEPALNRQLAQQAFVDYCERFQPRVTARQVLDFVTNEMGAA
jgi:glycosyltransferase involved in cell wall biosynthesis